MTWGNRGKKKYGNTKVESHGYTFDSRFEQAVFSTLSLRERAGEIRGLRHHPDTVYLQDIPRARIGYRPDYRWENSETGETEWVEAKGFFTEVFNLKKKLWIANGPGTLFIWVGRSTAITLYETVVPLQARAEFQRLIGIEDN